MFLKYISTLIITWVSWNVITEVLFTRDDLLLICVSCFIYAFNIVNITNHNPFAISTLAFVVMMLLDGSCFYRRSAATSLGRYYYCLDYDAVRILAIYSWALGGLIAVIIIMMCRARQNVILATPQCNIDVATNVLKPHAPTTLRPNV